MHSLQEKGTRKIMDAENKNLPNYINEEIFCNSDDSVRNTIMNVLDVMEEAILVIDKEGIICYVNNAYLKLFHVTRERIICRKLSNIEPNAHVLDILRTQNPLFSDIAYIRSANIDVMANLSPLIHNGKLVGAVASMMDFTQVMELTKEVVHFKALSESLQQEILSKDELSKAFNHIIGHSPHFMKQLRMAQRAAQTGAPIYIEGESGTGKELLANAIHQSSERFQGPFIVINCASIPENLLESELFGYETGAFTGAKVNGKPGKFELANKGTLFLDEIGDMPLSMQAKLLRILQDHKIERVGGTKTINLDFRLITATNKILEEEIAHGNFREDLYYRIHVVPIHIPPLRNRKSDIPVLASVFLNEANVQYGRTLSFSPTTMEMMLAYYWPGNVRELKNLIAQISVLCDGDLIKPDNLPAKFHDAKRQDGIRDEEIKPGTDNEESVKLKLLIEDIECAAFTEALAKADGNKSKAIEMLGISRRSFYQKLRKYGL